eukprot:3718652-Amphidinium_carterae.1
MQRERAGLEMRLQLSMLSHPFFVVGSRGAPAGWQQLRRHQTTAAGSSPISSLPGAACGSVSYAEQVVSQAPNLNELDIGDNNIGDEQASSSSRESGLMLDSSVLGGIAASSDA